MQTEIQNLVDALRAAPGNEEGVKRAAKRVLAASQDATAEDKSEAVRRLSANFLMDDWKCVGMAATVCGALVERGANPAPMERPLLEGLLPALRTMAQRFADEPAADSAESVVQVPAELPQKAQSTRQRKTPGLFGTLWHLLVARHKLRRAMKQQQRTPAKPATEEEEMVNALSPATIAMFSASPSLRSAHPEVGHLAKSLSGRVAFCDWLQTVFEVLENEPLLVIEPSTHCGILARLSGVDVNFTLTMLLMHRFPGPDGQPHSRLSANAASVLGDGAQQTGEVVTGVWNLYNWPAIDSYGALPPGQGATEHWIWNEGTPADIAVFEGRRVILLGPAAYSRTWPAQRTFAAMKPELRIEKVLTPDEVQGWLAKMAQSLPASAQVYTKAPE